MTGGIGADLKLTTLQDSVCGEQLTGNAAGGAAHEIGFPDHDEFSARSLRNHGVALGPVDPDDHEPQIVVHGHGRRPRRSGSGARAPAAPAATSASDCTPPPAKRSATCANAVSGSSPLTWRPMLFEWGYKRLAAYCRRKQIPYPRIGPEGEILDEVPRG